MARKVNWEQIKAEYVSGDISQKNLAKKYGVSSTTLSARAKRENWTGARKKLRDSVVEKAVRKAANKQANVLAKELTALDRIEQHLNRALADVDQFNRHIVTDGTGKGMTVTHEQIFTKADMKALKDAAQVLRMVEDMKKEQAHEQAAKEGAVIKFENAGDDWGD